MVINRTRNTFRNVIWGGLNKVVGIIGPFCVQTIIIKILGIEYVGINGLFSSILNILNLAELGIGTAIIYSMYSAVANDDDRKICALLNFYKKTYYRIGGCILGVGLLLIPFLHITCPDDLPDGINIYIIYVIVLSNTVVSYFFYSYIQSIIIARQQNGVIDKIRTNACLGGNAIQIIILCLFQNYYFYILTMPLQTIIINLLILQYVKKKYPQYSPVGSLSNQELKLILRKTKALLMYKIGCVILVSVDNIVISVYLGVHILGQYNSYSYVINALFSFIIVIFSSMTAGIANSIVKETIEKNYIDFKRMFFLHRWLMGAATTTLLCSYEAFMRRWIGESEVFSLGVVVCFCAYFYFMQIVDVVNVYRDAAGLWEYDKWRPISAAVVNLFLNIFFVNYIGLYAIILSTVISIAFIIIPWSTYITFKYYFCKSVAEYFKMLLCGVAITFVVSIITYKICSLVLIQSWLEIPVKIIISFFLSNTFYFIFFSKSGNYTDCMAWLKQKKNVVNIRHSTGERE